MIYSKKAESFDEISRKILQDMQKREGLNLNTTAFALFLIIVLGTLVITYFASKKTKNASEFYTAGGGLTGWQNGLAIAGDYMSAASFLGIAGAIALTGFDGFFYSIGFFSCLSSCTISCCRTA